MRVLLLRRHWRAPVLSLTGVFALSLVLGGCRRSTSTAEAPAPSAPAAAPAGELAGVPAAVERLLGRWVRTDGGYVIELQDPQRSGAITAAYFNPRPIRVSRAIWMQGAEGLQVVVELNDTGYQGSTYILNHDAGSDRLVGKYHQPAAQQTYDIEFVRQNPVPLR